MATKKFGASKAILSHGTYVSQYFTEFSQEHSIFLTMGIGEGCSNGFNLKHNEIVLLQACESYISPNLI